MSQIQSVLFDKKYWNKKNSSQWLKYHGLKPKKISLVTENFIHYRIKNSSEFKRLRTIKTDKGIDLVIGFKKPYLSK